MAEDDIFPYNPSKWAPILFTVLFGLTLITHCYQATRARALFMLTLIIATAMEVVGYITRYISADHNRLATYIISQVLIVVSPSFLQASEYMIIGRMMSYVGPEATWISHAIITKLFVIVDAICVLTQAAGSSVLSGDEASRSTVMTGRAILIAGLILQIVSFCIFLVISIAFDFKARSLKGEQLKPLRPLFTAFYISAGLIIGRSIFRTVEFGTIDFDAEAQGYLWNNEWPFYVLDAIPIFIAIVIFNIYNPSSYLPRKKGLRMDGSVEPPRKHWWSKVEKTTSTANPSEEHFMNNRV